MNIQISRRVMACVVLMVTIVGPSFYMMSSLDITIGRSYLTTWPSGQLPPKYVVATAVRNGGRVDIKALENAPREPKSLDQERQHMMTARITGKTEDTSNDNLKKVENYDDDIHVSGSDNHKRDNDQEREERRELQPENKPRRGKESEKNEIKQPQHATQPGKKDDKSTTIVLTDSSLKTTQTLPHKPDLNYTVKYRQVEASNYSRLFSYDDLGNCQDIACKWPKMPGATKELVKWAPEIFEKIPLHFLDNFKNPCWVRGEAELNCLPYFYIIGMFKCGTTDVWDKIVSHPDVVKVPKEPHWWGPRRQGFTGTPIHKKEVLRMRNVTGAEDDRSLDWYLNLYKSTGVPAIIDKTVHTKEGILYHPKVFGDSSISTAYTIGLDWTKTYPNASEPLFTTADLIRAVQPKAKIILMVRDPTVRANSWYWYSHGGLVNSKTWHNFTVKNIRCLQECIKKHNLRYCAYAADCPYNLIPELQVGIYHVFLRDWMSAFSRDGVLVIRLEDWQENSLVVFRQILKFLDLRQLSDEEENKIIHRAHKNVNRRKHEDMLLETKKILDDFYRPYNKELALLLNDDKFLYPSS